MTRDSEVTYHTEGTVRTSVGVGVGGVQVRMFDKNIRKDVMLSESWTDPNGHYHIEFDVGLLRQNKKQTPDLQAQVFRGTTLLGSSEVRYNASYNEQLDVLLPPDVVGLPSEYEALLNAVSQHHGGRLSDLQESAERQDVTYIARKTGLDASKVMLAVLAERFGNVAAPGPAEAPPSTAQPQPGSEELDPGASTVSSSANLAAAWYYALFRVGVPAEADSLFTVSPAAARTAWQQAFAQGVIPRSLEAEIDGAVQAFEALCAAHVLDARSDAGVSTLRELLRTELGDASLQAHFAHAYVQYREDPAAMWALLGQHVDSRTLRRLQLNGQLYLLTLNNAPLVAALHAAQGPEGLQQTLDLASLGYHDPACWLRLIGDAAVPQQIAGANAGEKCRNYAQFLAAEVRRAHPTAVAADLVRRGKFALEDRTADPAQVAGFLIAHQGRFVIGREPVEAYLKRVQVTDTPAHLVAEVKRLHRVHQLTDNDEAREALLQHGLDSAHAIAQYDGPGFLRAFQSRLGGPDAAQAIHRRARQIHAAVVNIAVSYLGARSAPILGGATPVHEPFPSPPLSASSRVVAYPTLESLFGSLDYCNCPECRSILSPAAYFVDLLNFTDRPTPTDGFRNAQEVLFSRRPDLQYLALTCENTNTSMPYIDIVNEVLEHLVAHGSLDSFRGHDTSADISTEQLLAAPQYVDDSAYDVLRSTYFPPPLPFNRPLEMLRGQLGKFGVKLSEAMTVLRADDAVERKTQTGYGWRDILMEELGLSREEYRLLTDINFNDPLIGGLAGLYGLAAGDGLTFLQQMNLQAYSRRTGVSYDDLFAIVKTRFINPGSALIPRLERLGVPFSTLTQLQDGTITEQQFEAHLAAGLDATEYGGSSATDLSAIGRWVTDPANAARIDAIVIITDPGNGPDQCSGDALQFRYSDPDAGRSLLSATDFVKLIRFIRLWRKLGLTVAQTDEIVSALYPAQDMPVAGGADDANLALLDAGMRVFLPRVGHLFRLIRLLGLDVDRDLSRLLVCWAPIGTAGDDSLYRRMFLGPLVIEPGPQAIFVDGTVNPGDVFVATINDIALPAGGGYTAQAGDTDATVAAAIAAAINATTNIDPDSELALNRRIQASARGGVVTVRAGFTLECATEPAAATEAYVAQPATPLMHVAQVSGTVTPGDVLVTTIDGWPIRYTVAQGDTTDTIAANIAVTINSTSAPDPYSGLPINNLAVASSAGSVVTVQSANAGAPFRLASKVAPAPTGSYGVGSPPLETWTASMHAEIDPGPGPGPGPGPLPSGQVIHGVVILTTINGVTLRADGTTDNVLALAVAMVAAVNGASEPDGVAGRPVNQLIGASLVSGSTRRQASITFTLLDPSVTVQLSCSESGDPDFPVDYVVVGPIQGPWNVTVAGLITRGSVLTTDIDGIGVPYTVVPGDTAASIATGIANAINATTALDTRSGVALNQTVSASAAGGIVTVAAMPGLAVTLTASLANVPPATFVAGRLPSPFADDGYGNYLQDPTQYVFGHEPTLRAAFNLTGLDFTLIARFLGFGPTTPMTLDNISAVFRVGWMARALQVSVTEFLPLIRHTGLDPFAPLDPGLPPVAEPPLFDLFRLLQALGDAGLQPVQALYLMWNEDLTGRAAPSREQITGLARSLRQDFVAVDAQFALKDDADGSVAKALMALVYGNGATEFFFGLLNNGLVSRVAYANPQPTLPQAIVDASNARLSYDDFRKELTFAGVLDAATLAAINAALTASGGDASLQGALIALADVNARTVGPFFTAYPELQPLYSEYAAGLALPTQVRRETLLAHFLPELKARRKAEQALATVTSTVGTVPELADSVLRDPSVLHAAVEPTAAALSDLTALEAQGLSVRFYLGNDRSVAPDLEVEVASSLDYSNAQNPLPTGRGGGPIAAEWFGDVEAPEDGDYDLYVATDAGASIALAIGGADIVMKAVNGVWTNQGAVSLKAGQPTPILITATSIRNVLSVQWAGIGIGRGPIPGSSLYPGILIDRLEATYVRFLKIASLASGLSLTPNEISSLGTAPDARVNTLQRGVVLAPGSAVFAPVSMGNIRKGSMLVIDRSDASEVVEVIAATSTTFTATTTKLHDGTQTAIPIVSQARAAPGAGWLNVLGVGSGAAQPALDVELRGVLASLLDFAFLKRILSPRDERLIQALAQPSLPNGAPAIRLLAGWPIESISALLQRWTGDFNVAQLGSVEMLRRLYDAFVIARKCRVTASALISAVTNGPSSATIGAFQAALRALYAERDWVALIQPLNDDMRVRQRDALVACVLQRFADAYRARLIPAVTLSPVQGGDRTLRVALTGNRGAITVGMSVKGPEIPVYATVLAVDGDSVVVDNAPRAAIPVGSSLSFVPVDAVAVDTPEKLFDLLFLDVLTQPAVRTSRLRLALSSVQVFIERVLHSLEPQCRARDVHASSEWQWMKRYRVWQANREVFLWPENWAYPEVRLDRSEFFDEVASALLQSDLTGDSASEAYLGYLTRLEEVAKLEPCGFHHVPGSRPEKDTAYVIARTAGSSRKYFFRQFRNSRWTPWTQAKIDCDDMPVVPVVWNGRLFLYWLKALKQAPQAGLSLPVTAPGTSLGMLQMSDLKGSIDDAAKNAVNKTLDVQASLSWSEYFNGKWQPLKSSNVNTPTILVQSIPMNEFDTDRSRWALVVAPNERNVPSNALALAIVGRDDEYTGSDFEPPFITYRGGFALYNTHSAPVTFETAGIDITQPSSAFFRYISPSLPNSGAALPGAMTVFYASTDGPGVWSIKAYSPIIANLPMAGRFVQPSAVFDNWLAPFFVEDRKCLFYVTLSRIASRMPTFSGFGVGSTPLLPSQPGSVSQSV